MTMPNQNSHFEESASYPFRRIGHMHEMSFSIASIELFNLYHRNLLHCYLLGGRDQDYFLVSYDNMTQENGRKENIYSI